MTTPATAERAAELLAAYGKIHQQVIEAAADRSETDKPRLVAVSKLKPSSDILALHQAGVIHFGENYVQELADKAQELPSSIQWHFIGALQSNKCKALAAIPNLFAVETLSSSKSADLLEKTLAGLSPPRTTRLNVYIQLNTSHEESKAGLSTHPELITLATQILQSCPHLRLFGLMTIGSASASADSGVVNPDFVNLKQSREELVRDLVAAGVQGSDEMQREGLELSMGMSGDFEVAIREGSSNVRVGSSIFGARPPFRPSA